MWLRGGRASQRTDRPSGGYIEGRLATLHDEAKVARFNALLPHCRWLGTVREAATTQLKHLTYCLPCL